MLKQQVRAHALWLALKDRVRSDDGAGLVETLAYGGAIAVVAVAVVALIRGWATGKVSALP